MISFDDVTAKEIELRAIWNTFDTERQIFDSF